MTALIAGLVIFLGVHSVRIAADGWRSAKIARIGERRWKGLFSLASGVGLFLIIWGYGLARAEPVLLWTPPGWTRYPAALLVLVSFVLVAAAYVPGNRIKAAVGNPMVAGVMLWAFAHLIANGRLADVLLFGAFLVWAVFNFRAARRRDRAAGIRYPAGAPARDAMAVVAGFVAWALFAAFLHAWLIGVPTFG